MVWLLYKIGFPLDGYFQNMFEHLREGNETLAMVVFACGCLICIVVPYLLGSLNSAIIVSKVKYKDDIRTHGSGNAGLTNMHRVYGKSGAVLTLIGDVSKQILSVVIGTLVFGEAGAYLAGIFCMLGHIAPVYYHFRGGKGVLTAATMVLLLDPEVFLILFLIFAVVLLLFRYVSLASMIAGFTYPAVVYYSTLVRSGGEGRPALPVMLCAVFIGLLIIFTHRSNVKRIYNGTENKFSFRKKPEIEEVLDLEDRENDRDDRED